MSPDAIADVVVLTVKRALSPIVARIAATDTRIASLEHTLAHVAELRERVAVVESRDPIPGPPGKDGAPGADGLGFDDLSVDFDGDRTLAFSFTRGDVIKSFPVAMPFLKFQGAYQPDYPYVVGDVVQAGGNVWHCQAPTTLRPGDQIHAWRLMVRKGRDGRDAAVPVGR